MNDTESQIIWKALVDLQARVHKLEEHKNRQIDENRAVSKELELLIEAGKKANALEP